MIARFSSSFSVSLKHGQEVRKNVNVYISMTTGHTSTAEAPGQLLYYLKCLL